MRLDRRGEAHRHARAAASPCRSSDGEVIVGKFLGALGLLSVLLLLDAGLSRSRVRTLGPLDRGPGRRRLHRPCCSRAARCSRSACWRRADREPTDRVLRLRACCVRAVLDHGQFLPFLPAGACASIVECAVVRLPLREHAARRDRLARRPLFPLGDRLQPRAGVPVAREQAMELSHGRSAHKPACAANRRCSCSCWARSWCCSTCSGRSGSSDARRRHRGARLFALEWHAKRFGREPEGPDGDPGVLQQRSAATLQRAPNATCGICWPSTATPRTARSRCA